MYMYDFFSLGHDPDLENPYLLPDPKSPALRSPDTEEKQ